MTQERPPGEKAATVQEMAAARRRGMLLRVAGRTRATVELVFPAAPALAGHYVDILADHFASIGRPFSAPELDGVRRLLDEKLREAFDASPIATVFVRYSTVNDGSLRIEYGVAAATSTIAEQYDHWVKTRTPPLFGSHPDARIMTEATALAPGSLVVDIGAGTGRNALPIARIGLTVFAVEPAAALAEVLSAEAAKEALAVHVVNADVTQGPLPIAIGRHALVVVSQVTSHFRGVKDLRALLRACAVALRTGGRAIVNVFVTRAGYHPDRAARELGQLFWTTFFTPEDLVAAREGIPLDVVSDQDALEYERAHLPEGSWPPTGWFEGWARGEDVFAYQTTPSIGLRWILFERTDGAVPAT